MATARLRWRTPRRVSRLSHVRTLALALFLTVSACSAGGTPTDPPEPTAALADDGVADESGATVDVGDWGTYAEPTAGVDWPTGPLDEERWAQVTAELACAGRAHHGDPEAHTTASRRILAHHLTTAAAVMDYGIEVNADAGRAHRLGDAIARATEACR